VGTPYQIFDVQVDTGSSDLLIYGQGCQGCEGVIRYTPQQSSSAFYISCQNPSYVCESCLSENGNSICAFTDTYGDGSSVSGYVVTDSFAVGNYRNVQISFGSIVQSTANFENPPTNGIWGLAYPVLSSWHGEPVFQSIVDQELIYDSFSMCLYDGNAVMTMGVDYSSESGFSWTPFTAESYYPVQITDFQFNGQSLNVPLSVYNAAPGCIVDSGTTLFLLPTQAFNTLVSTFSGYCSSVNLIGICGAVSGQTLWDNYCYSMAPSDRAKFPDLQIYVSGTSTPIVVSSNQYLYPQQNNWCMGIADSGGNGMLLGDIVMSGYHIVFDRSAQRLGFGSLTTCPTVNTPAISTGIPSQAYTSEGSSIQTSIFFILGCTVITFCLMS